MPPPKEPLALLSKLEVPSSPSFRVLVEGFEEPPQTGYEPLPQASARAPPAWA